jgi:hypothetical protein
MAFSGAKGKLISVIGDEVCFPCNLALYASFVYDRLQSGRNHNFITVLLIKIAFRIPVLDFSLEELVK